MGVVNAIPFSEHQRRGPAAELQPELQPLPLRAATAGAAVAYVEATMRTPPPEGGDRRRGRTARVETDDEDGRRGRGPTTKTATRGEQRETTRCREMHKREMRQEEEDLG